MRLVLPDNRLEIAIENESTDETAYVTIDTRKIVVEGATGEERKIEFAEDLTLD